MTLDTSTTLSAGIDLVRKQFPALERLVVFLDNPAGTQISKQSLERINRYLIDCNAITEGCSRPVENQTRFCTKPMRPWRIFSMPRGLRRSSSATI